MSDDFTSVNRSDILGYFDAPVHDERIRAGRIADFIRNELGIKVFSKEWLGWQRCDMWEFALDEQGSVTEVYPKAGTSFEDRKDRKLVHLLVSRRGPFVTCETFTLRQDPRSNPPDNGSFYLDAAPDPRAVAWAQRIADRFSLHYLDASMLNAWEVDEDSLLDKAIYLDYSEPTAFNILFHE